MPSFAIVQKVGTDNNPITGMAKIKISCPQCHQELQCDEKRGGKKVKCPHCKHLILVPAIFSKRVASRHWPRVIWRGAKGKFLTVAVILILLVMPVLVWLWLVPPTHIHWSDRRPIGVLFLASNYHSSATNPRGWFNDPSLDVTGADGPQRFRQALMDYTDRSLAILKRTGAQGVIVWDLEGEQFPHKTSFIGDPRVLGRLAPEMAAVADEFFGRLRGAGLKVGLTVRPQALVFDEQGQPHQSAVFDTQKLLLEKIDYARSRWSATLFYVDSTGGVRRPDEVWQLRRLAAQRPDILLIPEHHYLPYWSFSAPYVALRQGDSGVAAKWARKLFPESFQALDIGDAANDWAKIAVARSRGDILLFRAWCWSPECELLEGFAHDQR